MAIQIRGALTPEWYSPPGQMDTDDETQFRLRPLDSNEYAEVADHIQTAAGGFRVLAAGQRLCLKYGLLDWKNLRNQQGDTVNFDPRHFNQLPYSVRSNLSVQILAMSSLSEHQEKN